MTAFATPWSLPESTSPVRDEESSRWPLAPAAFVALLAMPLETSIRLGDLRLSPYRILLLLLFVPLVRELLYGGRFRVNWVDRLMVLHVACTACALALVHGTERLAKSGGIYMVETLGAYLLARCAIRSADEVFRLARVYVFIVIALMVVTIPESLMGQHYARDLARSVLGGSPPDEMGKRFGLTRAYGPFDHPILCGLYCAASVSFAMYALRPRRGGFIGRAAALPLLLISTAAAVSSGAFAAAGLQLAFCAWDRLTTALAGRWWILLIVSLAGLGGMSLLSSRSPAQVLMTTLALSRETAYTRMEIFNYGSLEVMRHPWTGIGFNDWQRPDWMPETGSVDHFWLLTAMRFGLPSMLALAGAVVAMVWSLSRVRHLSPDDHATRMMAIAALLALALAGMTVHLWNALLSLFFFLIGAAVHLIDRQQDVEDS